jgi:hypothetical protein
LIRNQRQPVFHEELEQLYESGDGLGPVANVEYPDLQSTPRKVLDLALAIHDAPQHIARTLFPGWKNYWVDRRIGANLFSKDRSRLICVENARLDAAAEESSPMPIGWAAVSLVVGRSGLRVGDTLREFHEAGSGFSSSRRLHLSQYDVADAATAFGTKYGSLAGYTDQSDVAKRTSLVVIDVPPKGDDGPIAVAFYQSEAGNPAPSADSTELPIQALTDMRAYLAKLTAAVVALPPAA